MGIDDQQAEKEALTSARDAKALKMTNDINKEYSFGKVLGQGAYGKVFQVWS